MDDRSSNGARRRRRRLLDFLLVLLVLAVGCRSATLIPDQHRPWGELSLDDPVGWFTDTKLADLLDEPQACLQVLEASSVEFAPIEDRVTGDFCGYTNAVAVERSVTPYSAPLRARCPLAAGLFLWEREVLQPAALEHLGQQVSRIEQVGTYSCRRVNGSATGRPSEHATANAIDIVGFRLEDGSVVRVEEGWDSASRPAESAFLTALRDGACRVFRGVLGPDFNERHADHFHFDMGSWSTCR